MKLTRPEGIVLIKTKYNNLSFAHNSTKQHNQNTAEQSTNWYNKLTKAS